MRLIIWVFAFATIAGADFFQAAPAINIPASQTPTGQPSFTDRSHYNSYDFLGSPLGLFEKESCSVKLNVDYRSIAWSQAGSREKLSAWNIPDLLIGSPKTIYMDLYYAPTTLTQGGPNGQGLSLPLHRFGLTIAGQIPSGFFQLGFCGKGYLGTETLQDGVNTRLLLGLNDLSLFVGSRISKTITVGVQGGATAKLDTLIDVQNPALVDRYFTGQVPLLGGYIDFGGNGLPVAGTLALQTAQQHFVYVSGNDRDPLKGDSLAFKWQTIGDISHAGIGYHPALFIGYWQDHFQEYLPTEKNNDLNVGAAVAGKEWKLSNFCFGLGTSVSILQFGSTWFEYNHSRMGLTFGDAWAGQNKNKGYDRISLGLEANIHAIPALHFPSSIQTFARIGFFNLRDNSGINAFESEDFGILNGGLANSQAYRYAPDFGWGPDERIIGFTFGLGGTFFNKKLQADLSLTTLSKFISGVKSTGTQLGIDCAYMVR
ncbi:MAG: hypothetical protein PHC61_12960 [Chitinivibrionales bacterium]|nr:hypothetical protein [Chitinivibrionales bacterium]